MTTKKNHWKILAAVFITTFGVSLAIACAPAVPPGPAACNNQPNMAAAILSLDRAHDWLLRAEHNKGGWRDEALRSADGARSATIAGCQYADTH